MQIARPSSVLWLVLGALAVARPAAAQLGDLVSPGPLAKAHASIEGLRACEKCHEPGRKVSATKCLACHEPIAARIKAKRGVHRDAASDCVTCHVEHAGRDGELRPFDTKRFDHAKETGFPLDGKHAPLAPTCASCHKTRSFVALSAACASCHADPHKGALGPTCATCHKTSVAFRETKAAFDHTRTAFPLTAAHLKVACEKCHVEKKFRGVPFGSCADCHKDPHRGTLSRDCASCHSGDSFKTTKIDHARTAFPLRGKHTTVACVACHVRPAMQVKPRASLCADCHQDPHKGTFKQDCASCHTENGFAKGTFDHATKTRFPLADRHAAIPCAACHKPAGGKPGANGNGTAGNGKPSGRSGARPLDFKGLATSCASCHQDVHKGQLGTSCETCHTSKGWKLPTFQHPRFPELFKGEHAALACEKCHKPVRAGGKEARLFRGLSTSCASCHQDVHKGQLGASCETCHSVSTARFAASGFRHDAAFALTGKHATVPCASCHKKDASGPVRYRGVSKDCASCHTDPHLGQLGTACASCHGTKAFKLDTYQHRKAKATEGLFTGRHASVPCASCHKKVDGVFPAGKGVAVKFAGIGAACGSCHKDPHRGSLGETCATCHRPDAAWRSASRAFHKQGAFPLEGRHLSAACESCHQKGIVKGTPTRCYDCHWIRSQDDRYRTRLGNDCETCHRPTSWRAVNWNHAAATGFALSGPHARVACETCHPGGLFEKGRITGCVSCHLADYQRATNPNHVAGGFPLACETCHKVSDGTFRNGRFDHAAVFPLQGIHATQPCASCHKSGVYKGTARTCDGCHKTDYDRATNPNHLIAGFPMACETCHKVTDPTWRQGTFNHARWPLVGAHTAQTCASCHRGGVYAGTSQLCQSCHLDAYQKTTAPNHAQAAFAVTCETCHKVSDPTWKQGRFDHNAAFPLQGVHATQACASCHRSGVYKGTARTCDGCHKADYDKATSPNHLVAGFPTACETCHKFTDPTWRQGTFNHVKWPLVGAHTTQTCASCHRGGVYTGTSQLCQSCHLDAYQKTTAPNHAQAAFPVTCEACHKVSDPTWKQGRFDHNTTFALQGVHATQACASCHRNGVYKGTARTCDGCHKADYDKATNPNHLVAGFPTACETCHKFTDPTWKQGTFNHAKWPLVGAHGSQACASCHRSGVFTGTSQICQSCHLDAYQKTTAPSHAQAGFSVTCEVCHRVSDTTWRQGRFDHATVFALQGVHATQDCASCHRNGVYKGTPRTCDGCHRTDYDKATNPNHLIAGFPTACETCHRFTDPTWKQGTFDHARWPLVGAHTSQPCASCHRGGVYTGTSQICQSCHLDAYQKTTAPNHAQAGFSVTCEVCHRVSDTTWKQGRFDHNTTFPLQGVHATQDCASCHRNGVYKGTPRSCDGCHKSDYDKSTNPNHLIAGFPLTCETCHKFTDPTWKQGTFSHAKWPLVGAHTSQPCASCHRGGVYTGTSQICQSCHLDAYQKTTAPNHTQAGFPVTCEVCHRVSDTTWKQGRFDHNAVFPLQGVHATQACASCHKNGVYKGTPRTCDGCHKADYDRSTNPNHLIAGFPLTCETCHKSTDSTWKQGTFNHAKWPLVGAHTSQPCASCHRGGVYTGTSQLCQSCHLDAYQRTTAPNHAQAGFPVTCEVCHRVSDTTWKQGRFDHNAAFPLQGVHATQACAACHKNGVYKGTPRTCVGCHQPEYQRTSNPNHLLAGFGTSCETCHRFTDAAWTQGTYAHTRWPLVGAHTSQPCASCHRGGVFTGTSQLCQSCHLDAYQRTTSPNHAQSGFPVTCEVCHRVTDTTWRQGRFDHNTTFPLQGVHATQACAACHVNGVYRGTPRTCVGCHLTSYQRTSNPNHLLAGFGTSCDSCHRFTDAAWTQGTYTHVRWPLLGVHATQTCATCHRGGVFTGTSTLCSSCHLPAYQAARNPNHISAGFPATCEVCHRASDTTWQQGRFTHTAFPIASGRHSGNPCSACHQDPNNYQSFTCLTCHGRTETDNEHRGRAGYRYESAACYSCHPQGRS